MWRGCLRFAKQTDENLHANNLSSLTLKAAFDLPAREAARIQGHCRGQKEGHSLIRCSTCAIGLQEITHLFGVSMFSTKKVATKGQHSVPIVRAFSDSWMRVANVVKKSGFQNHCFAQDRCQHTCTRSDRCTSGFGHVAQTRSQLWVRTSAQLSYLQSERLYRTTCYN